MGNPMILHALADSPPIAPIEELDRVRLKRQLISDDGRQLEAGWTGTIVSVYADGGPYCIELTEPMQALATVARGDIEVIAEETVARLASSARPIRR